MAILLTVESHEDVYNNSTEYLQNGTEQHFLALVDKASVLPD